MVDKNVQNLIISRANLKCVCVFSSFKNKICNQWFRLNCIRMQFHFVELKMFCFALPFICVVCVFVFYTFVQVKCWNNNKKKSRFCERVKEWESVRMVLNAVDTARRHRTVACKRWQLLTPNNQIYTTHTEDK